MGNKLYLDSFYYIHILYEFDMNLVNLNGEKFVI